MASKWTPANFDGPLVVCCVDIWHGNNNKFCTCTITNTQPCDHMRSAHWLAGCSQAKLLAKTHSKHVGIWYSFC